MVKTCRICGAEKPLHDFCRSKRHSDGRNSLCKQCVNGPDGYYQRNREHMIELQSRRYRNDPEAAMAYHRQRKYGVSQEWYEERLSEQNGACKICGFVPSESQRRLSVDHDHTTGAVRGLICYRCNSALGYAGDSVERLEALIAYLKDTSG